MPENLDLNCPQCGNLISVPPSLAGQRTACPRCESKILVPGTAGKADDLFSDLFDDAPQDLEENGGQTADRIPDSLPESMATLSADEFGDLPGDVAASAQADDMEVDVLPPLPGAETENERESAGPAGEVLRPQQADDEATLKFDPEPLTPDSQASSEIAESDFAEGVEDDLLPVDLAADANTEFRGIDEQVKQAEKLQGKDPFAAEEDARIPLDGLEGRYGRDSISVACPVCDSRIFAHRSRAGSKLKCDDCFTLVEIPPIEEWEGSNSAASSKSASSNADATLGFPDDEATQPADPDELKVEEPVVREFPKYDSDDEYQLEPLDTTGLVPDPPPAAQPVEAIRGPGLSADPDPGSSGPDVGSDETISAPAAFDFGNGSSAAAEPMPAEPVEAEPRHPIEKELFQRAETLADPADLLSLESTDEVRPESPASHPSNQGPGAPSAPTLAADDDDLGYGLLPLDDEPAADRQDGNSVDSPVRPIVGSANTSSGHSPYVDDPIDLEQTPKRNKLGSDSAAADANKQDATSAAAGEVPPSEQQAAQSGDSLDFQEEAKQILNSVVKPVSSVDNWRFLGFFLLLLALTYPAYAVFGACHSAEDFLFVVLGYGAVLPMLIILTLLSAMYQGVVLYNMMLSTAHIENEPDWPEFQLSDWFGQSLAVGPIALVGCIPGLLVGSSLWAVTGYGLVVVPMFAGWSMLVFSGPLMMAALYNESIYNVVAPKLVQSVPAAKMAWMVFAGALLPLFVVVGIGSLFGSFGTCVPMVQGIVHGLVVIAYSMLVGSVFRRTLVLSGDTSRLS